MVAPLPKYIVITFRSLLDLDFMGLDCYDYWSTCGSEKHFLVNGVSVDLFLKYLKQSFLVGFFPIRTKLSKYKTV